MRGVWIIIKMKPYSTKGSSEENNLVSETKREEKKSKRLLNVLTAQQGNYRYHKF